MARWIVSVGFIFLLSAFVACTLTVDEEALSGGGGPLVCASGQKECELAGEPQCVSLNDPNYGCARHNCIPCNLPNAVPACSPASGQCFIGACTGTWANCDRASSNGCEINLANNAAHCGRCGQACPSKPNADVACGNARCYVRLCDDGFKDCNRNFDDGCEIDILTDNRHCGACDLPCDGTCEDGVCHPLQD